MGNNRSRTEKQREGNTGAGGLSPLALWAVAAGAAFQLAVFRQIGTEGGVSYASPCLAYGVLLLLSAFGVPEAVAGITAAKRRKGRRSEASALFWSALVLAFLAGGVLAAALWFGGDGIAAYFGRPMEAAVWRVLAPAGWLMVCLGVIRGYFSGMGLSWLTEVSLVLEQIFGGAASLWLALSGAEEEIRSGLVYGTDTYAGVFQAEGAVKGLGAGAALSLAFLILMLVLRRKKMFPAGMGKGRSPLLSAASAAGNAIPGLVTVLAAGGSFLLGAVWYGKADPSGWAEFARCETAVCLVAAAVSAPGVWKASVLPGGRSGLRARLKEAVRLALVPAAAGGILLAVPGQFLYRGLFGDESASWLLMAFAVSVPLLSLAAVFTAALFRLKKRVFAAGAAVISLGIWGLLLRGLLSGAGIGVYSLAAAQGAAYLCFCLLEGAVLQVMTGGGSRDREENVRPVRTSRRPETGRPSEPVSLRGRSRRRR